MVDEDFDDGWIRDFAAAAGLDALDADQVEQILAIAGMAAHDSGDRRNAPLACFLTGLRMGRAGEAPDAESLARALR